MLDADGLVNCYSFYYEDLDFLFHCKLAHIDALLECLGINAVLELTGMGVKSNIIFPTITAMQMVSLYIEYRLV